MRVQIFEPKSTYPQMFPSKGLSGFSRRQTPRSRVIYRTSLRAGVCQCCAMMVTSSRLTAQIREALSLARRWETERPSDLSTHASLMDALRIVIAELSAATGPDKSRLLGYLLEAFSVAQRWEAEDPPSADVRATLQKGMEGLVAQIRAVDADTPSTRGFHEAPAPDPI
jgi:hypothetical protein